MGFLSGIGDAVGGLLGGASDVLGGSSSSDPSTVWAEQSPYLTGLYSDAANVARGSDYGKQMGALYQAPTFGAFADQSQGGQQTGMGGLQNLAASGGGFEQYQGMQNQALSGAINAGLGQIGQNFQRNIMPAINTGAALSGTSGGSRQGIAQGLAAGEANQQASDFVAQMQSGSFDAMQARNLQAQQSQAQTQLGAYGQMGQFNQAANQAQQAAMQSAPQLAGMGMAQQFGELNALSGLYGGPTVLGGGSTSSGGIGSSLGGMASMGALAMMSDQRTKENIERVGELDNGLNIYAYNYIGSNVPQIGLIAQEVEEVNPSAVEEICGIKHVNYKEAVKDLAQPVLGEV